MTQKLPRVDGFRTTPKRTAKGRTYLGVFTCHDVQWTGSSSSDLLATFTITADELADAAKTGLLWTDQDVQRGIQPGVEPPPAKELSLADGYPDPKKYVFNAANADDIAEKLLIDEKLFLSALVWNLRPGTFEAYWDENEGNLYIYSGRVYLPDSHHRQQAIIKAVEIKRNAEGDYPAFSPEKEFKVDLYFLSREDEGNYFFDKNQRPTPTAMSKAYDLTTFDDLSLLAKKVIDKSKNLQGNVNRVTDRMTQKNPQVVTLSTLREMMKTFAPHDSLEGSELDGMADIAATFYDMLAEVRPELGHLDPASRRIVRDKSLVDSAVMMQGYATLMKMFGQDLASRGTAVAQNDWRTRLQQLGKEKEYTFDRWTGDVFAKGNPLWRHVGVVKPGRTDDKLTVINTGGARSECSRVLRQLLSVSGAATDLKFLVAR